MRPCTLQCIFYCRPPPLAFGGDPAQRLRQPRRCRGPGSAGTRASPSFGAARGCRAWPPRRAPRRVRISPPAPLSRLATAPPEPQAHPPTRARALSLQPLNPRAAPDPTRAAPNPTPPAPPNCRATRASRSKTCRRTCATSCCRRASRRTSSRRTTTSEGAHLRACRHAHRAPAHLPPPHRNTPPALAPLPLLAPHALSLRPCQVGGAASLAGARGDARPVSRRRRRHGERRRGRQARARRGSLGAATLFRLQG